MTELKKENFLQFETDVPVRVNKFLSDAGFCSRRQADRLIINGDVYVDGKRAELGTKVFPGQSVSACGNTLTRSTKLILLAYHKPAGVECTTAKENPDNIIDRIGYPERIYPIGRLDKNSTGLILLTNTGELVNAILKSVNRHEKEYEVKVNKPVTQELLQKLRAGVYLEELDVTTRECKVEKTGKDSFRIVLTQGFNRQIRRMCSAFGYKVVSLHRTRILNIQLQNLQEGCWRQVTEEELSILCAGLNHKKASQKQDIT